LRRENILRMRQFFLIASVLFAFVAAGCSSQRVDLPQSPVIILFENDVHCAVEGYPKMAALKEVYKGQTPYVATVSCGDFVQGDLIGAVSQGEYIVDIMNQVGYDVVTLGNHEFDYGIQQQKILIGKLQAATVCANFQNLTTGELEYAPYEMVSYGAVKIAFLGIATPATATSVSPKTFQDPQGNTIYSFLPDSFFTSIQRQIDAAREQGADYVVALSHLGDVSDGVNPTSVEFARKTKGVDVVLDGHSHSVIAGSMVQNVEGEPVLLASTGTKFENIGVLELSVNGDFSVVLVPGDSVQSDAGVQKFVEEIQRSAVEAGEYIVGESRVDLPHEDAQGNRLTRYMEMPLGNFCADAFRVMLGTDIGVVNGGGIRNGLLAGDITYNNLISVFPFNNSACVVSLTGQQLMDALEASVYIMPEPFGGFLQVSGLRFCVDTSVNSPVEQDASGLFKDVPADAQRRVSDVQVLDPASGKYIPLVPSREYTIGGITFLLRDSGDGGIFRNATLLHDNLGQDTEILSRYLQQELGGVIDSRYADVEGRIIVR